MFFFALRCVCSRDHRRSYTVALHSSSVDTAMYVKNMARGAWRALVAPELMPLRVFSAVSSFKLLSFETAPWHIS